MSSLGTLLIVDDEAYVRESLAEVLARRGFEVRTAGSAAEALAERNLAGLDAVLTDLRMPEVDGAGLLDALLEREPELPVVLLTGYGTVASAVAAIKRGAADYLLKPIDPQELALVMERTVAGRRRQRELEYLRQRSGVSQATPEPLGASPGWRRVLDLARAAALVDSPVHVAGASGTGKGEVARLIHRLSSRRSGPFVQVNCAALEAEGFESELFGHRRGAFPAATTDRDGRLRIAHGGTLFLDEIDALPPLAQARLVRVLEEGAFEPLGEGRPCPLDVRLVTATQGHLPGLVATSRFRADLYYRIHVLAIRVPPLAERREDITILAEYFLAQTASRLGKPVSGLAGETRTILERYPWPGNVRELRNVIERSVLLESSDLLTPESLPFDAPTPPERSSSPSDLHLRRRLRAAERSLLVQALQRCAGVKRDAAKLLGVDERNLAYFLRKHGLLGHEPEPDGGTEA